MMNLEKVEGLKQKIKDFNILMKELSEDLNEIFIEGKEQEFHDILLEMLKSLDKAQETVKQAYNLFLTRKINDN